jgi:hypothetical protein
MNIYGVEIVSDVDFPLNLPVAPSMGHRLQLLSSVPAELRRAVICGFPFYSTHGRKVYLYSDRIFDGNETGQPWCYEVKDVMSFYWRSGEKNIYYELAEHGDVNLLSFWFIHLVLPLFLSFEGVYDFLHAGCVDVNGRTIMFIAPSMGGKSTLTDFFIKQGHGLISDDKVPTVIEDGQFFAGGSHPYHRPHRRFEELGYHVDNFISTFNPIRAFYALESVGADGGVTISEILGAAKFNTFFPNYLYNFHFLQKKRLLYLSRLLNSVPFFNVTVPRDFKRLPEVHDTICKHSLELV